MKAYAIDWIQEFMRKFAVSLQQINSNETMDVKKMNKIPYGMSNFEDVISWEEYLNANQIEADDLFFDADVRNNVLHEYVRDGGFPECATYKEKKDYLISLYQKIFLGDIAMRNKVENTNALRLMFMKMAESVMQPIALTRLTNIINLE